MANRFFVPADMQAIARYERTFGFEGHEITLEALRKQIADYTFQTPYQMTLDDLKTAVENIQRMNPTVYDMIYAWWYPLYHLAPFGILEACGYDPKTGKERPNRVRGLIVDECDVFYNVWTILGDMPQEDYKKTLPSRSKSSAGIRRKKTCQSRSARFRIGTRRAFCGSSKSPHGSRPRMTGRLRSAARSSRSSAHRRARQRSRSWHLRAARATASTRKIPPSRRNAMNAFSR